MQRPCSPEALRQVPPAGLCHGQQPCGSTGSPPKRGVGAHAVWSGHVLAPDPRLALIKAWVFFALESRDPTVSGPDPPLPEGSATRLRGLVCTYGDPKPRPEARAAYPRVRYFPVGVRTNCCHLRVYRLLWPRGGLGVTHVEGSGVVHRTTRDSWASSLHTVVRGTPDSGYRQWPPGPPQRRIRACRWGQCFDRRLARCFRALTDVITASPPSVTPTATPVPVAD